MAATGGTITYAGGYTYHTFTSSGTFAVTGLPISTVVLLVGGGGGAGGANPGASYGGGGGAGGMLEGTLEIAVGDHAVVIGPGGTRGASQIRGSNGGNTTVDSYVAYGGGGGGGNSEIYKNANSGGSGGGGAGQYSGMYGVATQTSQSPLTGYGFNGSSGDATWRGGCGGSASGAGLIASPWGRVGRAALVNGVVYSNGGGIADTPPAVVPNTGNGGWGSATANSSSNGASGIVIIKYLTPQSYTNQTAVARIAKAVTKTQSSTSRIAKLTTITTSATANIIKPGTAIQLATARIAKSFSNNQLSTARIAKQLNITQLATARMSVNSTKTQSALARIATNNVNTAGMMMGTNF